MSFWQRLRDSLRSPMHVKGIDDPEVEVDIAEEMPDAAEDAENAEAAQEIPTAGGTTFRAPNLPPPAETIAFEGAEEEAREDAEASDQHAS
jgi:hypothetical protein